MMEAVVIMGIDPNGNPRPIQLDSSGAIKTG
jgi:hypothetical protein